MKAFLKTREIKKRLIQKNISQNELAYQLEISSGYISQLMNGARSPSPQLRERIMGMFPECRFKDLFRITHK